MNHLFAEFTEILKLFLQGMFSYRSAKIITALVFFLPGISSLIAPKISQKAVSCFPRNKTAGKILSGMALVWSALLVYYMPLDFLAKFKGPLFLILVVFIPFSWKWMSELLAVRSLAGLMCLLPAPILLASRFAPGDGRLIIVSLMYVLAVVGMVCCFSPFYLRDIFFWYSKGGNIRARVIGGILLGISILAMCA